MGYKRGHCPYAVFDHVPQLPWIRRIRNRIEMVCLYRRKRTARFWPAGPDQASEDRHR